jgi:hypothetical protein
MRWGMVKKLNIWVNMSCSALPTESNYAGAIKNRCWEACCWYQ